MGGDKIQPPREVKLHEAEEATIRSGIRHIPRRIIRFLFGDCAQILVLKPGETVRNAEIREVK